MNVTYRFQNLQSLADHLDNKAREIRSTLDYIRPSSHNAIIKRTEAAAYESIAHILRNTILEEK